MSKNANDSPRLGVVAWYGPAGKLGWGRCSIEKGVPCPSEPPCPEMIGIWRPQGWRGFVDRYIGRPESLDSYSRWAWGRE